MKRNDLVVQEVDEGTRHEVRYAGSVVGLVEYMPAEEDGDDEGWFWIDLRDDYAQVDGEDVFHTVEQAVDDLVRWFSSPKC